MAVLVATLGAAVVSGVLSWAIARQWPNIDLTVPQTAGRQLANESRHPRLAALMRRRLDPQATTGLALTAAGAVVVVGIGGFGLLLFMVRSNTGFARFDLGAARFGAKHATAQSTHVLRLITQLGGAVVLVPLTAVVAVVEARRRRPLALISFLTVAVGGQFLVVDVIKWLVDRARPNLDRLTGFSGPSFPSGHAAAASSTFAAFALVFAWRRSARVRSILAGAAVGLAVAIASSRVFLGVHWLTDVLAGLALGWAWFALCAIAFGGRLLRLGAPVEAAEQAVTVGAG